MSMGMSLRLKQKPTLKVRPERAPKYFIVYSTIPDNYSSLDWTRKHLEIYYGAIYTFEIRPELTDEGWMLTVIGVRSKAIQTEIKVRAEGYMAGFKTGISLERERRMEKSK
jgi:hypothetical protein